MNKCCEIVNIIIPVYNCEKYIERCLKSISEQTYRAIRIIVVNDGSTDSSSMIMDEIAKGDQRFVVIHQDNAGVCTSRNNALEQAVDGYITFIDGDDYVEPDYIEKMVQVAMENNSELVISGFIMEDEFATKKSMIAPLFYKKDDDEIWAYRLSAACGRLYKKSLFDEYNIRYTTQAGVRGEDVPICLLANYVAKNISVVNYAGYHYVQHEGSAMAQFRGLKKYGFPYEAMLEIADKIKIVNEHNGQEFFDVGILKLFAQFYYDLGRGAEKKVKLEMINFFSKYIKDNCPNYKDSWKNVKHKSELPLTIRIAIALFIIKMERYRKTGN